MKFPVFRKRPKADLELVFFISTGRCGTMHLSKCFKSKNTHICHEYEPIDTNKQVVNKLVPLSQNGDVVGLEKYFYEQKVPAINKILGKYKNRFIDTGHQINFGQLPVILNSEINTKFVRLRRNLFDTARSFLSTDEKYDIWNRTPSQDYFRWTFDPFFEIAVSKGIKIHWHDLSRIQKVLWALNEVELIWQFVKKEYSLDYIEIETESLERTGYDRIANYLSMDLIRSQLNTRHNSSKLIGRKLPKITNKLLEVEWTELLAILSEIEPIYDFYMKTKD